MKYKKMTPADLKNGMFGKLSNGEYFVVVGDNLIYQSGEFEFIRYFDKDLRIDYARITHVLDAVSFLNARNIVTKNLTDFIIWERGKTVKLTLAEIEEKLGYPVEIVDEEEDDEHDAE